MISFIRFRRDGLVVVMAQFLLGSAADKAGRRPVCEAHIPNTRSVIALSFCSHISAELTRGRRPELHNRGSSFRPPGVDRGVAEVTGYGLWVTQPHGKRRLAVTHMSF